MSSQRDVRLYLGSCCLNKIGLAEVFRVGRCKTSPKVLIVLGEIVCVNASV